MEEQALRASQDDLLEELLQLSHEYQSEPHDDTPPIHLSSIRAEALEYSERLLRPLLSTSILTRYVRALDFVRSEFSSDTKMSANPHPTLP